MTSLLKELRLIESKKDDVRRMLKPMLIQGTYDQDAMQKKLQQRLKIKPATADTYYHMIVKELNLEKEGRGTAKADHAAPTEQERVEDTDEVKDSSSNEFDDDGNYIGDHSSLEDGQFVVDDDDDRRGIIRKIDNAHLIYKRRNSLGTFDELWVYNVSDNMKDSVEIKKNILSATDIPYRHMQSKDGSQKCMMHTMGNAQFLEITNLPQ